MVLQPFGALKKLHVELANSSLGLDSEGGWGGGSRGMSNDIPVHTNYTTQRKTNPPLPRSRGLGFNDFAAPTLTDS